MNNTSRAQQDWAKFPDILPELGGEYQVVWKLDDNRYPVVTCMDWDSQTKIWTDPRGVENQSVNHEILYWKDLDEPPADIPKVIWSDEPVDDKAVYGHCMHGENMAVCEICKSY